MHTWASDKICKPKKEEGLDIRRIKDINQAAGLKLVWRCCSNPKSVWASWMMNEYVKDSNFWEAPMHLLHSGTWKFIAESKQIAKKYMKVGIGNGEHASLWYDPWLKEGALIDHVGKLHPDIITHPDWK